MTSLRPDDSRPGRTLAPITAALAISVATLAGAACVVQARARRAERDHPPEGSFIEMDGVRIHYIDRGRGSPVVLLHGNGAMIEDWEISGVAAAAAERHRVVVFDRPGFGYSDRPRRRLWSPAAQAELLRKCLRSLGVERPIVVGHSWGTLVALALALDHPDDVRGLVLLSGYYYPTPRVDVALMAPPAVPIVGDVMRYTVSPLLGRALAPRLIAKIFAPAPVSPRFAAEFPLELALRPSQIRATAADTALMAPAAATLSKRYGQLKMPVGIMAGVGDQIVDFESQSRRLSEAVAGSQLRPIAAAGHMSHHLAPDAVIELIEWAGSHT